MSPRETFLHRVRRGVMQGNRAGAAPPLPQRFDIGYQGAGADPVARFCQEFTAAGGFPFVARDPAAALQRIQEIVHEHQARKLVIGRGPVIDPLDLVRRYREPSFEVTPVDSSACSRETFFGSDLGITGVEYLVAETGTVVMATKPNEPRSTSLLPPVHIAIAHRQQILPDLFDLFDLFSPVSSKPGHVPPSCLSLITGPSKTGDIELKLVTGVHGPGAIYAIVGTW